jgi:DNA-binding transcriptional ArsR family regulator
MKPPAAAIAIFAAMREGGIPLCPIQRSAERHAVVSTFLTVSELLRNLYLPGTKAGAAMESVVLAAWISRGHAEGRPLTIAKLSHVSGLAPTTVRNKLKPLLAGKVVERRRDGTFAMCEARVNSPAIMRKVEKIVGMMVTAPRKIQDAANDDALGAPLDVLEAQGAP